MQQQNLFHSYCIFSILFLYFQVESQKSFQGCLRNLLLNDGEPRVLLGEYDVQPCSRINENAVYFGTGGGTIIIGKIPLLLKH